MRKKPLQVTLDVREPSLVDLSIDEKVQLDRLVRSQHGYVAERHGKLLAPGLAQLSLDPGVYFFKTLSDASLKVVRGGVVTTAQAVQDPKDPWPDPLVAPLPTGRGDDLPGELPRLIIE